MSLATTLDPARNCCPDNPNHIHIIGICGTGMAAMAGMLKHEGYRVTGSDQNVYSPMSDFLEECGIEVQEGYCAENLEDTPDLVIVGNVVRATNPEAIALAEQQIPYLSMPQALGEFFLTGHRSLVVTGTHGKTTTASLLATTLHRAGSTPGFMIGGIVEAFGSNFNISQAPYFVVEGDEYDTAFFNKVSKFHHYRPECAILTSVEFDHADIFADLEAIKASFAEFIERIPPHGLLVAHTDDEVVRELVGHARCPVVGYGLQDNCLWQVKEVTPHGLSTTFTLAYDRKNVGEFTLPMPGVHNVLNATAVIALLHHLGFPLDAVRQGLATFEGVKRRQQIRGCAAGVTIVDDFAHHPTAVTETVKALRMAWPERRLIIIFEPCTNSSRRSIFQQDYAVAFQGADQVIVREHIPLEGIPIKQQFSSITLVKDLKRKGLEAAYFQDTDAIINHIATVAKDGDVIAVLSNGGFDNIHERLLTVLAASEQEKDA
jgi:UDP-N-acetylmuramate: L-alanyl-gamma-D-glutamyl-meso-diaminopimelate ligase